VVPGRTGRSDSQAGFTLLEVLAALVVLGFLAAALSQGVQLGLLAWQSQAQRAARNADLDAVDRIVRTLIEQMDPGAPSGEQFRVKGTDRTLAFRTALPDAASPLPVPRADVELGLDAAHRLVLAWRPYHRVWLGPPKPQATIALVEGVQRVEFAYWQRSPGAWVSAWPGPGLPPLVRVRIVFPAGSTREWPDIVAGPRRERW
jgi:general secretion pathway protein J